VIYFPTNWGAKECQNLPKHRVVEAFSFHPLGENHIIWVVPLPRIPLTIRICIFLVGDPYKPSFANVTGRGDSPTHDFSYIFGQNA